MKIRIRVWHVLIIVALLFLASHVLPIRNVQAQGGLGTYKYINSATTTVVHGGVSYLDRVVINGGTAGAVTLYDIAGTGCSGTPASGKFATIEAIGANSPVTLTYETRVNNGICVVTAAATDVTVVFN